MVWDRFLRWAVAGLLVVACDGCSSGGPDTVPVSGTLTIDGQPADGIVISLIPVDANLPSATGRVENGRFTVYSGVEGKPGAVPGKYKVVLYVTHGEDMAIPKPGEGTDSKTSKPEPPKLPFPEKYQSASTSDKEVEVTTGSNTLNIEIESETSAESG